MRRWLAFAIIVGCSQSPSRDRDRDRDDDGGAAGEVASGESGRAQASGGASGRATAGTSGSKASGGDANGSGGNGEGGEGAGSGAEGGESAGSGAAAGDIGAGRSHSGAGAGGSGGPQAGSGGSGGSSGEAGSGGGSAGSGGSTAGSAGSGGASAGSGGSTAGSAGTSGSGNVGCTAPYAVGDDGFVRARAMGGICWNGYAYAYADSGSSIAPTTFSSCGSNCTLAISGTLNVAVLENNYAGYAQLGFALNQPAGTSIRNSVTPTGSGIAISYTVSGAPSLRMELNGSSSNWCAELEVSSGSYSIPYTAFETCFTQTPTMYARQPVATVSLTLPGDAAAHSVSLQLVTLSEY